MVVTDLEGTLADGIAALHYAGCAGRLVDAKKIFSHLIEEERRDLYEAKTLNQFIKRKEVSQRFHIEEGALLLEGLPTSILKAPIKPSKVSAKIFEMGKRDKNTTILTCTEETTALGFCKEYQVPFYKIAASSKLQTDFTGKVLTGKLERYCGSIAKAAAYSGKEDVIGNSCIDLSMCKKANENNRTVYVVDNNHSAIEQKFLQALEKFEIPFTQLY
jgi:hypothetical protein